MQNATRKFVYETCVPFSEFFSIRSSKHAQVIHVGCQIFLATFESCAWCNELCTQQCGTLLTIPYSFSGKQ